MVPDFADKSQLLSGSVIRGSGSQIRGARSEIQWDPPNLTHVTVSIVNLPNHIISHYMSLFSFFCRLHRPIHYTCVILY